MYIQNDTPLGGSLALSSLVAVLPLLTLFVLLGGLRVRAWLASLIGLAVALLVAILAYGMPVGQACSPAPRARSSASSRSSGS